MCFLIFYIVLLDVFASPLINPPEPFCNCYHSTSSRRFRKTERGEEGSISRSTTVFVRRLTAQTYVFVCWLLRFLARRFHKDAPIGNS